MKLNREKKVEKINTYNKKAKSCYNLTGKKNYKNRENDKNEPDYNKDHIFSNINTHIQTLISPRRNIHLCVNIMMLLLDAATADNNVLDVSFIYFDYDYYMIFLWFLRCSIEFYFETFF